MSWPSIITTSTTRDRPIAKLMTPRIRWPTGPATFLRQPVKTTKSPGGEVLGLYVRVQKVEGDDRRATYSFSTGDKTQARTLIIDLDADRIWPEDGNR